MFGRTQDETHDETRADHPTDHPTGHHTDQAAVRHEAEPTTRGEVVARERQEHGGLKIGSAFFGWLTATGMAVLLSALVAVTGLVAGDATGTDTASEVSDALDVQVESLGLLGIIVALAIMFVAYYSGGYVAGRMARFDGIKQGIAVWGWALVIAVVVGVLGAVADNEYTGSLGMPQVSFEESTTTAAIVAIVSVLLVSLVGAMLGGLAGMRFHRRVDRTGLGR
ncbi:MAG: hypothetical protein ACXWDL_11450 [Nocardioides sp.]